MNKDNNKNPDTCKFVNRKKDHEPIENHDTAAWAEIDKQESEAKVPVPSIDNVVEAKEWVEENKK